MRKLFILCFLFASILVNAQVTTSPALLNFFTVYTGSPDSISLSIQNNYPTDYVVEDVLLYHDAFSVNENAFTIPAGGSHTLWVKCDPRQNVKYADYIYLISSSHPVPVAIFTYAFVKHPDTYYDVTQDKYHEDLKAALKSLLNFGTTDLSYNVARDSIFMQVDNLKTNGGGAAQNTLECVYTGTVITGFLNRADAQTNYNFNTEHTFPQSLFSSNWPMVADMHHLFAVTSTANTERSNKPFGIVSSPSWTQGGSKANGSTFEPRDTQKGVTARALFYFVTRFQDFSGFTAPQEATLRNWSASFPPTPEDVNRNDIIQRIQSNRNPYVDHPEFLERIASVTTVNNGPANPIVYKSGDTLYFQDVPSGTIAQGVFHIGNQGWSDMNVSNFTMSDPAFTFAAATPSVVKKDSIKTLYIDFAPIVPNQAYNTSLTFGTDDPANATVTVYIKASSIEASIITTPMVQEPFCWPNPSSGNVNLERGDWTEELTITVTDLQGRAIMKRIMPRNLTQIQLETENLPAGIWLVRVNSETQTSIFKIETK